MAKKMKILAFSGSTRKESWNKKLLRNAIEYLGDVGAEVTIIDLADYPLPFYDQDLEEAHGFPENVLKLRAIFAAHDAFLIASPEYNGSYTAVLKNVLDWVSRPDLGKENYGEAFRGKAAALIAASEGSRGGVRGLDSLRSLLANLKVIVLPEMAAVGTVTEAFNEAGKLKDRQAQEKVRRVSTNLVRVFSP